VTIQAQILELLRELRQRLGMSIILITHDLGVVAEIADRVAVMYAGRIVEEAPVDALFGDPQHPYTLGLLASMPGAGGDEEELSAIEGMVPSPYAQPSGCRFNPRCPFAIERCRVEMPVLAEAKADHRVACWRVPIEATLGERREAAE
ncbi:MAG: oligopeptide/dipeptide ABC transporter ATP-binding protein, partial [Reyranellaceae bacterium]